MKSSRGASLVLIVILGGITAVLPATSGDAVAQGAKAATLPGDPALQGSAIAGLLDANGGRPPATGKELWVALEKIGKFAQLPVVYSSVWLDSSISNPRVVIAPVVVNLSDADLTHTNTAGRLFLAANLVRGQNGADPHVASVEFISWNSLRRKFDFGFIEGMGTGDDPQVRIVDSGRCISCHKTHGPILGEKNWSNTSQHPVLRLLVAERLRLTPPPPRGQPAVPGGRDRIDGMALAKPDPLAVDSAVRLGSRLRLDRETFQLMNQYPSGRKAFVAMLVAIAHPGELAVNDRQARLVVGAAGP
jgi:hypothetical protein